MGEKVATGRLRGNGRDGACSSLVCFFGFCGLNFRLMIFAAAVMGASAAASAATANNPYTPIVQRNIFALNPLPTNNPADQKPPEPPSKIIPNGIMTIFGKVQVLFKVQEPGKAGQPAKELSYVLGEGERQDDIEVQKINEKAAAITFNNRGIVQTLELVKATSAGGAPAPGGAPPVPGSPAAAAAVKAAAAGTASAATVAGFGARFGRSRTATGGASGTGGAASSSGAGTANSEVNEKGIYQPRADSAGEQLTAEQRIILIEAQRHKMLEEGDATANLLPPTPITKELMEESNTE
jgi:hypothetical protein